MAPQHRGTDRRPARRLSTGAQSEELSALDDVLDDVPADVLLVLLLDVLGAVDDSALVDEVEPASPVLDADERESVR